MTARRAFVRDERGAGAAEFALILPVFLLFLLGIIDVGRYMWAVNEAEKATQIGARWAVATDLIPYGLTDYSFVIDGGITQGLPVPSTSFSGIHCEGSGNDVACNCINGTCPPNFDPTPGDLGQAAFDMLVARMRSIYPRLSADDVQVDYLHSGLGFAGDPNGADVAPLIQVSLLNQRFPLFFMLGNEVSLPSFSYALTMEDGSGTTANY